MVPNTVVKVIANKNPLEESLSKLDLQGTLVLLTLLSSRALQLQQEQAKKDNISSLMSSSGVTAASQPKLMKPDTAIKLPHASTI